LESFHEQARLLVDRKAERTPDPRAALRAQERLRGRQEASGNFRIPLGFKKTKEPDLLSVLPLVEVVDVCGNSAHGKAAFLGEEKLHRTVIVEMVFLRIEKITSFLKKRRDPMRVVLVKALRQFEKSS